MPSYFVTTPIYYVNAQPHIGHSYTTIACDVLARFKRLDGFDVKFLTGTDEHGQKIARMAEEQGITPQALADKNSQAFRDLAKALNISNDDFIRTTEPRHVAACQALWKKLADAGHIYLGKYAGWYAVRDEAFYDESELTTSLDGAKVAPTGAPVEWVEEESYFFDLSKWQDKLLALYDSQPDLFGPKARLNEVRSFVSSGLQDLSVSRTTFSWGIPVPGDPKHVMYVWIDALTNYITSLGYPGETAEMANFWPHTTHVIGKEIIRFHCVHWPAFLMAVGLPLPKRVFAHGHWTVEGQKMSKSVGNAIDPYQIIAKYGVEQYRYFLLREVPFGNDGDFSEAAMANRINSELANELGNLAQRFLSFIAKNLGGVLPAPGTLTIEDEVLLAHAAGMLENCRAAFERQAFHDAIEAIWVVVRGANGYVDKQAPWTLRKTDPARMNTVLYVLAETVRHIAVLMQPFTPDAAAKMLDQLAVPADARTFAHLSPKHALKGDTTLPAPQGVFPRYGDPKVGGKG